MDKTFAVCITIVGIFYSIQTVRLFLKRRYFQQNGLPADAVITRCERKGDDESSQYLIEVHFRTVTNETITANQTANHFVMNLKAGQSVAILYNATAPQQFVFGFQTVDLNTWIYAALALLSFSAGAFAAFHEM